MDDELISVNEENFIKNYTRYNFETRKYATNHSNSIKNKIWSLLFHKYNYKDKEVFKKIEEITKIRNAVLHRDFDYSSLNPDLIISWFCMLEKVIFKIYNNE